MEIRQDGRSLVVQLSAEEASMSADQIAAVSRLIKETLVSRFYHQCVLLTLSMAACIGGGLISVFAPDGRETIALVFALVLIIVATGLAGFGALDLQKGGLKIGDRSRPSNMDR